MMSARHDSRDRVRALRLVKDVLARSERRYRRLMKRAWKRSRVRWKRCSFWRRHHDWIPFPPHDMRCRRCGLKARISDFGTVSRERIDRASR